MDENDRIIKFIELRDITARQFATEVGIQSSTLSNIVNKRNKPSLEVLQKILLTYTNLSPEWLILGEGPVFRQKTQSQQLEMFDVNAMVVPKTELSFAEESSDLEQLEKDLSAQIHGAGLAQQVHGSAASPQATPMNSMSAPNNASAYQNTLAPQSAVQRRIQKVVLLYDDGSFEEIQK